MTWPHAFATIAPLYLGVIAVWATTYQNQGGFPSLGHSIPLSDAVLYVLAFCSLCASVIIGLYGG